MSGPRKPTHIYISGPMRAYEGFNFPAFFAAEAYMRQCFPEADICNPAREDVVRFMLHSLLAQDPTGLLAGKHLQDGPVPFGEEELREALGQDLFYVTRYCDLIVMLPGWQKSKGALAEVAAAQALGIKVVVFDPDAESQSEGLDGGPTTTDLTTTLRGEEVAVEQPQQPVSIEDTIDWWCNPAPTPARTFAEQTVDSDADDRAEVRLTSPTGGQKGAKLAAFDQVSPEVELLVAEHFGKGAKKYAAHNFRKGYAWSLSYSSLRRHLADFWAGREYDVCPEDGRGCQIEHPATGTDTRVKGEHGWTCFNHTGSLHIVAAVWHAMVLTEFSIHHKEYDDRYVYTS